MLHRLSLCLCALLPILGTACTYRSAPAPTSLSEQTLDGPAEGLPARPHADGPAVVSPLREVSVEQQMGQSVEGRPLAVHHFAASRSNAPAILLFAGIHGDEQSTVGVMRHLVAELQKEPAREIDVYVIPLANPDGFALGTRTNAGRVDLNRNFPAKNWKTSLRKTQYWNGPEPLSEPESRALHDLVLRIRPVRILSLHSIRAGRHGNNYDGPAADLAALLSSKNGYNVLPTMGYPTPGSFGSWAGIDLAIPTITLELPSNVPADKAWMQNREALLAFIRGN